MAEPPPADTGNTQAERPPEFYAYAYLLGIREGEKQLFSLVEKAIAEEPPEEWKEKVGEDGITLYVNETTGETSTEHPIDRKYRQQLETIRYVAAVDIQRTFRGLRARKAVQTIKANRMRKRLRPWASTASLKGGPAEGDAGKTIVVDSTGFDSILNKRASLPTVYQVEKRYVPKRIQETGEIYHDKTEGVTRPPEPAEVDPTYMDTLDMMMEKDGSPPKTLSPKKKKAAGEAQVTPLNVPVPRDGGSVLAADIDAMIKEQEGGSNDVIEGGDKVAEGDTPLPPPGEPDGDELQGPNDEKKDGKDAETVDKEALPEADEVLMGRKEDYVDYVIPESINEENDKDKKEKESRVVKKSSMVDVSPSKYGRRSSVDIQMAKDMERKMKELDDIHMKMGKVDAAQRRRDAMKKANERKKMKRLKAAMKEAGATVIQKHMRGFLQRKRTEKHKDLLEAMRIDNYPAAHKFATRIQSRFRGFHTRKGMEQYMETKRKEREAAVRIQSMARGYMSRKRVVDESQTDYLEETATSQDMSGLLGTSTSTILQDSKLHNLNPKLLNAYVQESPLQRLSRQQSRQQGGFSVQDMASRGAKSAPNLTEIVNRTLADGPPDVAPLWYPSRLRMASASLGSMNYSCAPPIQVSALLGSGSLAKEALSILEAYLEFKMILLEDDYSRQEIIDHSILLVRSYNEIGLRELQKGAVTSLSKAAEYFFKALGVLDRVKKFPEWNELMDWSLNNVVYTYYLRSMPDEAYKYLSEALSLPKTPFTLLPRVATFLHLGALYSSLFAHHDMAVRFAEDAFRLLSQVNMISECMALGNDTYSQELMAVCQHNMAVEYMYLGKANQAMRYAQSAMACIQPYLGKWHPLVRDIARMLLLFESSMVKSQPRPNSSIILPAIKEKKKRKKKGKRPPSGRVAFIDDEDSIQDRPTTWASPVAMQQQGGISSTPAERPGTWAHDERSQLMTRASVSTRQGMRTRGGLMTPMTPMSDSSSFKPDGNGKWRFSGVAETVLEEDHENGLPPWETEGGQEEDELTAKYEVKNPFDNDKARGTTPEGTLHEAKFSTPYHLPKNRAPKLLDQRPLSRVSVVLNEVDWNARPYQMVPYSKGKKVSKSKNRVQQRLKDKDIRGNEVDIKDVGSVVIANYPTYADEIDDKLMDHGYRGLNVHPAFSPYNKKAPFVTLPTLKDGDEFKPEVPVEMVPYMKTVRDKFNARLSHKSFLRHGSHLNNTR